MSSPLTPEQRLIDHRIRSMAQARTSGVIFRRKPPAPELPPAAKLRLWRAACELLEGQRSYAQNPAREGDAA